MLTTALFVQALAATALFCVLAPTRRVYRVLLAVQVVGGFDQVFLGGSGLSWVFSNFRLLALVSVFVWGGVTMITRRLPSLLALPAMGVLVGLVGPVRWDVHVTALGRLDFRVIEGFLEISGEVIVCLIFAVIPLLALVALNRAAWRFEVRMQFFAGMGSILALVLLGPRLLLPFTAHWYYQGGLSAGISGIGRFLDDGGSVIESVLETGPLLLHRYIITMLFGAMLASFFTRSGIARTIIRGVAELGGDSPRVTAFTLFLVTAFLFTNLGGLGAIILVGSIVLPLLLSHDVPSDVAAGLLLLGISTGGIMNPVNWSLYTTIWGISNGTVAAFAMPLSFMALGIGAIYVMVHFPSPSGLVGPASWIELFRPPPRGPRPVELVLDPRQARRSRILWLWRTMLGLLEAGPGGVRPVAVFLPALPLILIMGLGFGSIPAFTMTLLVGTALQATRRRKDLLLQSMLDAVPQVAPAILIIIGLGVLIQSLKIPNLDGPPEGPPAALVVLGPLVSHLTPSGCWSYVTGFFLAAPLALYRGPLNIWGMGTGLAEVFRSSGVLSVELVMGALLSVGQVQGISDPTNTHNIWVASYTRASTVKILFRTLPYALALAGLGLILASVMFRAGFAV